MPWHSGKSGWIPAGARRPAAARLAILVATLMLWGARGAVASELTAAFLAPDRIVSFSAVFGVLIFALVAIAVLLRARDRAEAALAETQMRVADLRAAADRAEALVNADDQRLVAWSGPEEPPLVMGRLPRACGAPEDRSAFLAFGTWLTGSSASRLDLALERLRGLGETFTIALETANGSFVEAAGRTAAGRAVARFRDLSGDRLALAELDARHRRLSQDVTAMRALIEAAPLPCWIRDRDGALQWANAAYLRAVEANSLEDALRRRLELVDTAGRQAIVRAHAEGRDFGRRLPLVVAGERRMFDVVDVASEAGSAGLATDATELESLQAQMKRLVEFHARTLDQLATAVAVFGPDHRLRSYNAAFRQLFGLESSFLDQQPDESAVLERMRAGRRLPEQVDFKSWRKELFAAYQSVDAREFWWHLPDGQTLRVIANPHPQGGMTWIYENVTERLDLESRYNALIQVQGETLDNLAEGVAVFGSDGRLRLHNPAFARIWRLDPAMLAARPHVGDIARACSAETDGAEEWARFTAEVAGLGERRSGFHGRMERHDRRIIDYAMVPLPNGQTMVTFVDVTDTVQVERALTDRNEALEAADGLKNAFIQHVSYELRSPLTNIIGFAQLLADVTVGPLNDKQREYTGYILSSSGSLLAIVNDILDLATVDAGIITLDLGEVNVADTVAAATEGVRDRLRESRLKLETRLPADLGNFVADEKRIRQILYNLLSNAVGFSPAGATIRLAARRAGDMIEFTVSDEGPGIPADFIASVFERFESRASGSARGGAGLGLAIVRSFVELHGGSVAIVSEMGRGTTVTVRLPIRPDALDIAAE
ncbi:PAS-domain containing protein [Kaistia geumhonensis]|uniref:histidine kinase n=1 Tax=Kaistia geumhonensis TaxID=410839 RepID=A0ABU0M7W0_9HYPH|nr:PAS domain-containing sensor histidine kinase [Kaistia geumhonensis]MCX5477887.1 PAS-domain containing protein [Kaistia geumhonensis]MDQ0516900.1 signal transduction histidine kinase [Kaistia geumhonensis]